MKYSICFLMLVLTLSAKADIYHEEDAICVDCCYENQCDLGEKIKENHSAIDKNSSDIIAYRLEKKDFEKKISSLVDKVSNLEKDVDRSRQYIFNYINILLAILGVFSVFGGVFIYYIERRSQDNIKNIHIEMKEVELKKKEYISFIDREVAKFKESLDSKSIVELEIFRHKVFLEMIIIKHKEGVLSIDDDLENQIYSSVSYLGQNIELEYRTLFSHLLALELSDDVLALINQFINRASHLSG